MLQSVAAGAAPTEVRVLLAGGLEDGADALAALATAPVGALLVPGVRLRHAEDAAEVALTLEAAQGGLERLVASYLNLDRHAVFGLLRAGDGVDGGRALLLTLQVERKRIPTIGRYVQGPAGFPAPLIGSSARGHRKRHPRGVPGAVHGEVSDPPRDD